ncbi:MAG: ABC transporter substrate-binding protein [Evtepia sp.]|uniref:ABC transporter substrate-binding protein n=1 Tax=Evtepia sp. TaxID=2773933 RepID=UPI002A764CC1|nr:ABC transporter substrate-binding protein [Evtepia sp.]MDY3013866.1 ABC transporter substrate-binding protein [Evtepia sp.]
MMPHSLRQRSTALALVLALTLSLLLSACGSSNQPAADQPDAAQQTAIVLTDQAGREVKLDAPAQRLVSCYYITTYATIALGLSDRVVGLEKKADTRPIYEMAAPDLLTKDQVGTLKEFNVEAAAALEPDLVLMPKKLMDYADALTQLGIPVLIVNPENQESLEEMLTLIGKACGAEEKAQALLDYYHQQTKRMEDWTRDAEKPSVYMASNSSYLETAPDTMYQASLIQLAGGTNAAAQLEGDYWTEVSYESLLAMAPDVMILPAGASYTVQDILNDPQLKDLPAVKNQAVYQMPQGIEEWDSPIPSGILGALWLTSVLHPDRYPFQDFTKDAQDFYKTFYGFTLDAALITQ